MCFAASACSFATSNQAPAGSSPSRPPEPRRVWNASTTPSCVVGTPTATSLARESRIDVRIRRLPSSGPARWTAGALKYFSSAMSATCRQLAPPRAGVAAGEGLARDEQERMPALLLQQARPLEHVRAVARGRRRPGRRRRGAEELVHHDHRVGTAGREDGEVEDALCLRRAAQRRRPASSACRPGCSGTCPSRPSSRPPPAPSSGSRRRSRRRSRRGGRRRRSARACRSRSRAASSPAGRTQPPRPARRQPQGSMRRRRRPPPEGSSRDTARPPVSSRDAVVLSAARPKRRGRPPGRPRSSFLFARRSTRLRRAASRPREPRSPHRRRASSSRPHCRFRCWAGRRT